MNEENPPRALSIRALLLLFLAAVLLPSAIAVSWALGELASVGGIASSRALIPIASLGLAALGIGGALMVSRRLAKAVDLLRLQAEGLQDRRKNTRFESSGIIECDGAMRALLHAELVMRERHSDLQRRIDELTLSALESEQRVAQGQRLQALGRMMAEVAHDINNLLGVINNSSQLLRQQGDSRGRLLAVIERAVESGSHLLRHLLRFESGQSIGPRVIELGTVQAEMAELLRIVLGKRIQLEICLSLGLPRVLVDGSELELAMIIMGLNLRELLNGHGHVRLEGRLALPSDGRSPGDGERVLLSLVGDVHDRPGFSSTVLVNSIAALHAWDADACIFETVGANLRILRAPAGRAGFSLLLPVSIDLHGSLPA